MLNIKISTALPEEVIQNLRNKGAVFRDKCEICIIEVLEKEVIEVFDNFLKDSKKVDPVLTPNFGHPATIYIPYNIQLEVYQLLLAYKGLKDPALVPGASLTPVINLLIPAGGGIQYHNSQITIKYLIDQIESPDIRFNLIGLNALPSGKVICDLSITYSNCIIIRRIRKI